MDPGVKKVVKVAAIFLAVLGAAMVAFYKIQSMKPVENELNTSQKVPESAQVSRSEFEGIYSPDVALTTDTNRMSFFQVSRREDGSHGAVVRVETIGAAGEGDPGVEMNCAEVKIQDSDFFLRCAHDVLGEISVDTTIQRQPAISLSGKVLWTKNSSVVLDKQVNFLLTGSGGS